MQPNESVYIKMDSKLPGLSMQTVEWERLNRKDLDYQPGSLYYQGLLVLDYWRTLVRHFREIPLVIPSAFEGGYMEPATRLHSEMKYEDIRARM